MVLKDILSMQINGKEYYHEPESKLTGNPCEGCVGYDDNKLCDSLMDRVNCAASEIIWKEYKEEPVKAVKDEVDAWVAAGMPEGTEKQIAGTKYDDGKVQYTLVPPYALQEVARNLTEGLKKYKERNNWQKVPNAEQRYMDALMRHFEAIRRGEIYDVDSSVPDMPHMAAVAVNAMFLLEFMLDPKLKKD